MIIQAYIDIYRTKEGKRNMTICGDGYALHKKDMTIKSIPYIVNGYHQNLLHKYGQDLKVEYYIDIRGIGMGMYDLLKEDMHSSHLDIRKMQLCPFPYIQDSDDGLHKTNNNTVEVKFDKLIKVDGDISHYHDSTSLGDKAIEKMTEIANDAINKFNTKIKNDLNELGVI